MGFIFYFIFQKGSKKIKNNSNKGPINLYSTNLNLFLNFQFSQFNARII